MRGLALASLALLALHALGAPAPSACAEPAPVQGEDPAAALQLASFDQAWQRIEETFPHEDMNGVDWNAVRDELRPKAQRARTAAELRPILEDMLGRLGASHFGVIPGDAEPLPAAEAEAGDGAEASEAPRAPSDDEAALPGEETPAASRQRGDMGFDLRPMGRQFIVTRVEAGSPASSAGVQLGWSLRAVDGVALRPALRAIRQRERDPASAELEAWFVATRALLGEPGSVATLTFETGQGARRQVSVERRVLPGESFQLGNIPALPTRFEAERLPGGIVLMRFNVFMVPVAAPFAEAVKDAVASGARGVIIDLRGNPGGIGGMVMGLGGHFISTPGTSLGRLTTRDQALDFIVSPRGKSQLYAGPLAVLIDGMSASTSEIFAAGLQQVGRARLFGSRTAGKALPSIVESLPNGDRLQFALADFVGPSGQRIEGEGVRPDTRAPLTRQALLRGRDATLEAARRWIASQDDAPAR